MKVTYDRSADALYIQLVPGRIPFGGASETVVVSHDGAGLDIQIDLDADGRPIGIEILDVARRGLEGDRVLVEPIEEAVAVIA